LQCLDFVASPASYRGDDGAFHAARNVRLVTGLANALDYVRNLLLARFFRHVYDHCCPPIFTAKTKAAMCIAAFG
jgi:hypothetical protein